MLSGGHIVIEILKSFFLGIIQGITEWLPISSTGHMILFNSFFPLNEGYYSVGGEFVELFLTVIQFGSILAVIFLFFNRLNLFSKSKTAEEKKACLSLWSKIVFGSIPAAIIGFAFKDIIHEYLYNSFVVASMLILYGLFFIFAEKYCSKNFKFSKIEHLNYKVVFLIGIFQALALVPGTSRSGATILCALLLGCSRSVGAEFSFFLAIPTMLGASALEILSYFKHSGMFGFLPFEWLILIVGFSSAFIVSMLAIPIFMNFVRKHSFKTFAFYRILIGLIFLALSMFSKVCM